MGVFPIRLFGDPVLRQRCPEVASVDASIRKLMGDMRETMEDAPGVGLAAPQIGVLRRVIVWHHGEDSGALANARIVQSRGSVEDEEACLSVPGLRYPVAREERIVVEGLDETGKRVQIERGDFSARILQHEIDHTDGILFIDRLGPDLNREARRKLRELALGETEPETAAAL